MREKGKARPPRLSERSLYRNQLSIAENQFGESGANSHHVNLSLPRNTILAQGQTYAAAPLHELNQRRLIFCGSIVSVRAMAAQLVPAAEIH